MTKKFRVWDKQDKSFLSKEYLKEFKVSISWDGQTIRQDFWGGTKIIGEDVFVQQWTGLTDSQGVEIYEGDIITFRPKSNKPPFWQVIFDHGLAMYCLFNKKREIFFEYEDYIRGHICGPDVRIIGNIFQNPELLEKS